MTTPAFDARESAVLDAVLETVAPPECDHLTAGAALREALLRLPAHRLAQVRTLMRLMSGRLLTLLLAGRASPFAALDQDGREQYLRALADSPIGLLRAGFQGFKRLCTFVAYASTDARGANPLWPIIGYPGPRTDRGADADPVAVTSAESAAAEYDAIVVGSGAGGGVAAAQLAAQGRRVVVLEAGPSVARARAGQLEATAFGSLYLDSALSASDDLGISILAGSCVGGGTTVNWCTSLRITERVADQWKDASGGIDFASDLAPHYDAVSERLAVQTTSDHNANNAVLARGARALQWPASELPRNTFSCGEGCGYCGFGCAYGNKRSTAATYLSDAVARGAQVVAGARVERAIVESGRVVGVEAIIDGKAMRIRAPLVVMCAGSLRTPGILHRSGIASPHLGRHLRLHPTTAVFAEFDEPVETWHGPMQTMVCDRFADIEDGYGSKFEAVPAHPGLSASALPWRSRAAHADYMRRSRNAAALIVLTRDRGEGSVRLDNGDIGYTVDPYDAGHMLQALAGLTELCFAAGAQRVIGLHTDPIELSRQRASKSNLARFAGQVRARGAAPNRLGVYSAHQMGTRRMHRDPTQGVVDERGRVYGVEGLMVADASLFPLASGVNPMLTIMAMAHRSF